MSDTPRSETPSDDEILDAFSVFVRYTDAADRAAMIQAIADDVDAQILAKHTPAKPLLYFHDFLPAVDDDAGWRRLGASLAMDMASQRELDRTVAHMAAIGLTFMQPAQEPMTATEMMKRIERKS